MPTIHASNFFNCSVAPSRIAALVLVSWISVRRLSTVESSQPRSSSARSVFVKFTSLALNLPMRSSAALPFAMVLNTVTLISFVVVSNVGIVMTELNFAELFMNSSRLPCAIGVGLTSAAADEAGLFGTPLQPARIDATRRNEVVFQRIKIACKVSRKTVHSSAFDVARASRRQSVQAPIGTVLELAAEDICAMTAPGWRRDSFIQRYST